jgi:hypothetical protein
MKFNLKSFRLGDFLSKRINTILLIVILIIILTGHVVCSCSKMSASKVVEKLTGMGGPEPLPTPQMGGGRKKGGLSPTGGSGMGSNPKVDMARRVVKNKVSNMEGFSGANTNYGQSAPYLLGSKSGTVAIDTNSWNQPDMVVKCDGSYGKGVADVLGRPKQPIPLPEGELDMLATTQFKPECCPNFYSISTGCACMTTDQYNYLQTRGGNNVPYSEY